MLLIGCRVLTHEMVGKGTDIRFALAQGRHMNRHDREAVIEVSAELSLTYEFFQIHIGRGQHPHIHLDAARAPHRFDFPFLKHAEEVDLHREGNIADFIQEQGAAIRRGKQPFLVLDRSGKGPLDMPEKLTLQQVLGKDTAIHRDERPLPGAAFVNGAGDQLLARAAFPENQHGGLTVRDLADQLE